MGTDESLAPGYFDRVYAANADPWQFETSPYERLKYEATLAALPRPHFESAFEIGCSIGVLTELLAPRCAALLAVDVSEAALQQARRRVAALPQVQLQKMSIPQQFPPGSFDLIVLSEVGYYWSSANVDLAAQRIVGALRPGGALVMVHWTPVVPDYPLTGDAVHDRFMRRCAGKQESETRLAQALRHVTARREATYRLDVFKAADLPG